MLLLWLKHSPQGTSLECPGEQRGSRAAGQRGKSNAAVIDRTISSSGVKNQGQRGLSYPPSLRTGLTFRPLGGGPTVQPHHHGGKGHLALHTVFPDGIDDSSWEVNVEVAEEDDAVWVLRTDVRILTDPLDQGGGQAALWDNSLFPNRMTNFHKTNCWVDIHGAGYQAQFLQSESGF